MALRISLPSRNTMANALAPTYNTGLIEIYSSPQPAALTGNPGAAVLLGTCTFSGVAFAGSNTTTNGTLTGNPISSDTNADNNGTVAWFRVRNSNNANTLSDGTAGIVGGGADLQFDNTTIVSGGIIAITGFTLTVPE